MVGPRDKRDDAPFGAQLGLGDDERTTHWKGFQLLPFQIEAVGAIREGKNVLVSAPTGAGKTLVAEYAIADAVARGKRCVYTAPIKALSNQKYRDFRDDPTIDVGLMTGDVTIHPSAQVLIMTTEILRNSIFENPKGLEDVDYVIFDEVHYMDDPERGSVWEESLIFAPDETRFIALSATIDNLEQLGAWIREIRPQELFVVRSTRRPVPLRHRLYFGGHGVFDLGRLDWVRRNVPEEPRRPGRGRRGDRRRAKGRQRGQRPQGPDVRGLLALMEKDDKLPALVFCFSRKDCERLANGNARRSLLSAEESEAMDRLQLDLLELFQLEAGERDGEVFRLAQRGVAYHHAGMLPIHKEVVERMFTSGLIKLLFTTETFALGINMPARSVVFSSLRKFDGVNFDYLRTRDYMQMAGRAGRQGIDEEGLVLSTLEARDLRDAPLERILSGRPEPIHSRFRLSYSSILHLLARIGRTRLYEAWEKSFNQFQHRKKSRKARERNSLVQRDLIDRHLSLLQELGYIDEADELTPRGKVARLLYGFELQITEMLFEGSLEGVPAEALALIFVGLIHESRRGWGTPYVPKRLFFGLRRHIDDMLGGLAADEAHFGIPVPMKLPDWGLSQGVVAWCRGCDFEELEETTQAPPGDVCRTFRMAVQLLRQVRRTLDKDDSLHDRLSEAVDALNREEVDARRQLELG